MDYKNKVLFGTVMLEKNRWTLEKEPTILVSDWLKRFEEDGFDGMELWENHVLKNPESELEKIMSSKIPLIYLSSYLKFDGSDDEEMQRTAEAAHELSAIYVKFNFSNNIDLLDTHINKIQKFAELLPKDCQLLCECHSNTVMEDPDTALKVFKILNSERYGVIIHLFDKLEILQKWFLTFGKKVKHAHVHLYDVEYITTIRNKPELFEEHVRFIEQLGFEGSYTVEFTKGVAAPYEKTEDVYRNAVEDMKFIKEALYKIHNS